MDQRGSGSAAGHSGVEHIGVGHMGVGHTAEGRRLDETRDGAAWRRWGPYVSDRQWGTVREDYSAYGNAWDYLPHDHARSRAYRWGEDGIGGFGDEHLFLCLGVALWNESDPILKERLFGLTNAEGNHGEDVKEIYYYVDGTPTHSYMRMLYRYPQRAFPYTALLDENRRRSTQDPEFELIDTGVFAENRYFDVVIEYAKADTDDILLQVTAHNRGPETAPLRLIPQLWARNIWSWCPDITRPRLAADGEAAVIADHHNLGTMHLACNGAPELLFCDNDSNGYRLWGLERYGYPKDGINDYIVGGDTLAVNPERCGTKVGAHYRFTVPAGGDVSVQVRFSRGGGGFADFAAIMQRRRAEADEFYDVLQAGIHDADARLVQRQAFAGMLWSKQYYFFDVRQWLRGDPGNPIPPASRLEGRNIDWHHLYNSDVISMPDKWEYPWYASWDLAFHCVVLAQVDPDFAKDQLILLTREWYMHPNGQLPAFEWQFGDVNPPVHAWAAWRVYEIDRVARGHGDQAFLKRVFHKLMLNFTWWVNRKDADGRNIFQGGFLGLDNISIFDRSQPLPTGGYINQADATAWMAMYTLNLMRVALELATVDHVYEDTATKFFEHFLLIAEAISQMGETRFGLWDETDEFYYDVLQMPGNNAVPLRVRSIVGLIPLCAVEVLDAAILDRLPNFTKRLRWVFEHRPELAQLVSRWFDGNSSEQHLLSLLRGHRMKRLLRRMLDETEFLADYGIRSLSKFHERTHYEIDDGGHRFGIEYVPGDSSTQVFGGNSNWRGPIWMPLNYLIIESLHRFHAYYGDDFKVECPVGSGRMLSLYEVADEITERLCRIFLRGNNGCRPVFGPEQNPATAAFCDLPLFYEYFHGDNGRGLGASHQTGWTGLIALLLQFRAAAQNRAAGTESVDPRKRLAAAD
jgi:hypothetical protein